ncbi:MAG: tRNA pseudouridine(55) synthase TruB [Candidatus Latescibacterota bacterium]
MDGVLIVDKEQRWTSHDVVARIRKILSQKSVGHTGTLDPMAVGVLVICLGRATRIIQFLDTDEKSYTAQVRLGITTDSFDAEGRVEKTTEVPNFTMPELEAACEHFRGSIEQIPPMFSAVKVAGTKLYELARKGQEIARKPRTVTLSELRILSYRAPILHIRVVCSKGTYIRALAHDLGERLGPGAHLAALRRTRCGPFDETQSLSVSQVASCAKDGTMGAHVLSMNEALSPLLRVQLSETEEARFRNGAPVHQWDVLEDRPGEETARVIGAHGDFLGVAHCSEVLKPVCVLS